MGLYHEKLKNYDGGAKDFPEIASLSLGDGNFTDMDDQVIETDAFLWVNENKSKEIPTAGNALDNDEKLVVQNILQNYAKVFEETVVAGGANVEPNRIEMKEEWSSAKLQPMRKYTPAVQGCNGILNWTNSLGKELLNQVMREVEHPF